MLYWKPEIQLQLAGKELKKFLGKKQIIKHLYANGELSGTILATLLNLSLPTINLYLNDLIEEGIIEIKGKGDSEGGRRPNIYQLIKNSVYLLGIDISQHEFSISIFNNDFENISGIHTQKCSIGKDLSYVEAIFRFATQTISHLKIDTKKIMAVGISIPGLINSNEGISHTHVTNINNTLQNAFQEQFKLPVYIENDSKSRALAELKHGVAQGSSNTLVLQLDWGLGTGLILNGSLHHGKSGFSGEFSHILIEDNGELCSCGKRGCLETIVSGEALVRSATERLKTDKQSKLHRILPERQLTIEDIVQAVKNNDQLAITLITELGKKLGKGLSYLIQILNPELIILGGAIAKANEYLLTPVNQALFTYCIAKLREDTHLCISDLGCDAGVLSAATVALDRSLNN